MTLQIISFGHKHGSPRLGPYDTLQSVCGFQNPHLVYREPHWTGRDPQVVEWIRRSRGFTVRYARLLDRVREWQDGLVNQVRWQEVPPDLTGTCWIGCMGGVHRSVYLADRLGRELQLPVRHRELLDGDSV